MMNAKHDEMRRDAFADIIETLEGGYDGYYCDLHVDVKLFKTEYWNSKGLTTHVCYENF